MIVSYNSYRLPNPGVCCSSVGVDTGSTGKVFYVLFLRFLSFFFPLQNSFTKHNIKSDILQYLFLTCIVVLPTLAKVPPSSVFPQDSPKQYQIEHVKVVIR